MRQTKNKNTRARTLSKQTTEIYIRFIYLFIFPALHFSLVFLVVYNARASQHLQQQTEPNRTECNAKRWENDS